MEWKYERLEQTKQFWERRIKTYPDFMLYYKSTEIKTVLYWHKKETHKSMKQKEESQINLTFIWSIYLWQRVKYIQWGKDRLFNKFCWEKWAAVHKKNHIGLLTPYTQINLKWIKYFRIRSEIIQFLEENINSILYDTEVSYYWIYLLRQEKQMQK